MNYLFTSESVSEGHPDKVADQISDAILDEFLARDPNSKVACETLVTTGQVIVAGEVNSEAYIDIPGTARRVIERIGYNHSSLQFDAKSCGVMVALHEQSGDINRGVDRDIREEQGAGDQGMMFGYATDETDLYIPLSLAISHALVKELARIRRQGTDMVYLRPDAKSQVTIEYDGETHRPVRVDTIVVSTQHDEFLTPEKTGLSQEECDRRMCETITNDVRRIVIPNVRKRLPENLRHLLDEDYTLHVNPTGKFVIGGAHGGGAFSGKDPSKVDRSAAYAARHIAKNLVAAGAAERMLVQVAYAIGKAEPVSVNINTYGTGKTGLSDAELSKVVTSLPEFDLRPFAIEKRFSLRTPIYEETASYGHVGRTPRTVTKTFRINGKDCAIEVRLFPWEELDMKDTLRAKLFPQQGK